MSESQITSELPGELLIELRLSNGYGGANRSYEGIQAEGKPQTWRGIAVFAELTGWTYWKLHRLERIRRRVPPAKWKPQFTRRDLDDLINAGWIAEGDDWYDKFMKALHLQAQVLVQRGVLPTPQIEEPNPQTHSPASREEIIAVFEAVFRQWIEQMEKLGYRIAQIEEIQQRLRDNVISMLEMLELVIKSQGSGKITPDDEVTRSVTAALSGSGMQDVPRLRTLRLVYDLTGEMVEDALWQAKTEQGR